MNEADTMDVQVDTGGRLLRTLRGRGSSVEGKVAEGWKKFKESRPMQFTVLITAELIEWVIIGIFFVSRGYVPGLLKITVNKYMWIYVILQSSSSIVFMILIILLSKEKIFQIPGVILQTIIHVACFGYTAMAAIWGWVDTHNNWNNLVIMENDAHRAMSVIYIVVLFIDAVVIAFQGGYLILMTLNTSKWREWKTQIKEIRADIGDEARGKLARLRKNRFIFFYGIVACEIYQMALLAFFYTATSFIPELLGLMVNKLCWIYWFLELGSMGLMLYIYVYLTLNKKIHNFAYIMQLVLHFAQWGYAGMYVVWGSIDTDHKWTDIAYFPTGTSQHIQKAILILFGVDFLVIMIEAVVLGLINSKWGIWRSSERELKQAVIGGDEEYDEFEE